MKTVSLPAAAPALAPPAAALKLLSDERLTRWAARGSQAAFAVIFERHHQALHRYCHSIVGNGHDAADALQNTMLKALASLPGEQRTIALKPWLYRIAHNESISLLRARRGDADLDAAAHVGGPGADTTAESRERLRDLTDDLQELSEQQRGALLMRELGGLAFDDVSSALQISATAAKQSVYEARRALQALEEGRAMQCDLIRRTLSDGDRRTLRTMKVRGHLRACAGCRDFEAALRHRPAHLAALAPPLPLAAAAAILQGLLGGGAGHGGGGGLLAGLTAGAKSGGVVSLGTAKVATVAIIAGSAAGGAIYVSPDGPAQRSDSPPITRESASAGNGPQSPSALGRADDKTSRARSARRSDSAGLTSSPEAATTAEDTTPRRQTQRPAADAAPPPVTSPRPQPPVATAPARRDEPVADADRPAEGAAGRPSTVPAPAAAPYVPPARPAPAAAGAPVPATAPPAGGTAATAAPTAAPAASAIDLADAVAPPRRR